jgi:hypothetical protein
MLSLFDPCVEHKVFVPSLLCLCHHNLPSNVTLYDDLVAGNLHRDFNEGVLNFNRVSDQMVVVLLFFSFVRMLKVPVVFGPAGVGYVHAKRLDGTTYLDE